MRNMLRYIKYSGNNRINQYAYSYMRYTNLMCSRRFNLLVDDLFDDYLIDNVKKINKNYKMLIKNFCLI